MNLEIFNDLDSDRISALCSSIPQRNDYNGQQIQDKLSFWSSILLDNLVFTNTQLREVSINGLKPLCLEEVVEKLQAVVHSFKLKHHLMDKEDYDLLLNRNQLESEIITEYLIYKFKQKGALEITNTDADIIKLQQTVKSLKNQITEIEEQISKLELDIKTMLAQKKRQKAVYSLKKKKNLEMVLEKRLNSLHTVEGIVDKINDKTTELEILEAYSTGTIVLKEYLEKMDKAQDTVDALQDVLADHKEIEDVMNITTYDDVEEELEELLKQEKLEKSAEPDVESLIKELDSLTTGPELPKLKEKESPKEALLA
ncbi:hypothetical protein HDV06_006523 [Boothiomyces sp. JEL0866]|nr:hypothetical protein HDV06_006523 [Boothiomyces sp. JEL0866]